MRFLSLLFIFLSPTALFAQKTISFATDDGGTIYADLYGEGPRGLVLAHGGQFNKESWKDQAELFVKAGYYVLALDFRGYGHSTGPGQQDVLSAPLGKDVLAAVRYLHNQGAKTVSIVGASMGGWAAAAASVASKPGEIDRLVLLGSAPGDTEEKIKSPLLVIVARNDTSGDGPRLPGIQAQFEKAPQPKEIIIVEGSAHAQFLFKTDQSDRVMKEVLRFLSAK
jgi:pimeloyl-ACP methyl ester carboxylesterase